MAQGDTLWTPDAARVASANMTAFRMLASDASGSAIADSQALWQWSIDHPAAFWHLLPNALNLDIETGPQLEHSGSWEERFFPEGRLSFAANLLDNGGDDIALIATDETGTDVIYTRDTLKRDVAALATTMRSLGVHEGDHVGALLPNRAETVIAFLAAASLGAVFTSCSPDFGADALVMRFGQTVPKVLFVCDGYRFSKRPVSITEPLKHLLDHLSTRPTVIGVPVLEKSPDIFEHLGAVSFSEAVQRGDGAALDQTKRPFDSPLCVVFSSGTTGPPKAIVHGAGGSLLQHAKEHQLHSDIRPGDRVFFHSTAGWMMWNWLVSCLASGASIVLYDGNPVYPQKHSLFALAETHQVTHFGASARFYDMCAKRGVPIGEMCDLSACRQILSTGSPLPPRAFDYLYTHVKEDMHLASISGGSDILSCFLLGDPTTPVHSGELQAPGLGMAVTALDTNGKALKPGTDDIGELVCTLPFVSLPLGFLGDDTGERFKAAYFSGQEGVWTHGDLLEPTAKGGYIVHGRSDASLNPGGVKIGTGEIYAQLSVLDDIEDSIAAGLQIDGDEQVVLFVKMVAGATLDPSLVKQIKSHLRSSLSSAHVPSKVFSVDEIPQTRNAKPAEIAIKRILQGLPVGNEAALANPECLVQYKDIADTLRAPISHNKKAAGH
ncbi:MAG: acetoacetate--CoA ligase [Pseudomonadota bacterium]